MSGLMVATVAVLAGLGSVLVLFAGRDSAEAQPIPCEQWQQMHPGWPCADVPTYNPQPTQPPNTGAPAPIIPSLLNPPPGQGGGPGAGALTPPPLQGPPNMNNPIVPVPGYTPPVLPGNQPPAPAPAVPGEPAPGDLSGPSPQSPASEAPAEPASGTDILSQLERAARLHEQGMLTDREFDELKQRLLNRNPMPPPATLAPQSEKAGEGSGGGDTDPRIPLLLITAAAAFTLAGVRRPNSAIPPGLRHPVREAATTYYLDDGTAVEFDSSGRYMTPESADADMVKAKYATIFEAPVATADNSSLRDRGLPPTIVGGIELPSSPMDQMYLSRVDPPPGDNHEWFIAWQFIDPRMDDPAATEKPGWHPYALIVKDQNGYYQVTDPPPKGSGAAAAMAAGLAMWGFQRQPPGTGGPGGGRNGPRGRPGPAGPPRPTTVTGPKGESIPGVPAGATGTPTPTGKGIEYPIPSGTAGLDSKVTSIRVMDPVTTGKYQYPNGYVVYMNKSGQTVNPLTGRTVSNADPYAHIELPPK
ncbi:SHOCT domain-containing protein [Nocardia sp. 2]|uniref:SHOCT domain-containing protein n=1 Tax=Nocardia acididurans TaxID=2802282 RepID=A0ABS1MGB0_9NOCA|nr:SHOCT domain-containing protein [Nocardia acididurans]MBL1079597.1 SHOCT domain-containing protein [Nocardia acididurans]